METVRFYNTLTRTSEIFTPLVAGKAGMYTCGPTVYNYAHIGNFRAYVFEDLLRRTLEFCGYQVTQVMNLTDVDDKTIRDSISAGKTLRAYTEIYKKAFFEDLKALHIEPAEYYPAATDHIPEMIALIQTLMDKGFAYQADDKCVYFSIAKFPQYGRLARIDMENQRSGVRVAADEYEKDSVADFALWKAWDEKDGDVRWESPWGAGRPGWHIECSAMSEKYLGKTFDFHTGGVDNMFPHHEDEIAQSECANGCKFVNYWLHNEHLIVNGTKMSKSLGNFYTVRDLLKQGFSGREIRFVLLGAHYRKKLNFSFELLEKARTVLRRFSDFFIRLREQTGEDLQPALTAETVASCLKAFTEAMADDMNISEAFAALYRAEREFNKRMESRDLGVAGAQTALELFGQFDRIFAFLDVDAGQEISIPTEIIVLAEERQIARKNKDFKRADEIRDQLKIEGWILEDTPEGIRVKPLLA